MNRLDHVVVNLVQVMPIPHSISDCNSGHERKSRNRGQQHCLHAFSLTTNARRRSFERAASQDGPCLPPVAQRICQSGEVSTAPRRLLHCDYHAWILTTRIRTVNSPASNNTVSVVVGQRGF